MRRTVGPFWLPDRVVVFEPGSSLFFHSNDGVKRAIAHQNLAPDLDRVLAEDISPLLKLYLYFLRMFFRQVSTKGS